MTATVDDVRTMVYTFCEAIEPHIGRGQIPTDLGFLASVIADMYDDINLPKTAKFLRSPFYFQELAVCTGYQSLPTRYYILQSAETRQTLTLQSPNSQGRVGSILGPRLHDVKANILTSEIL